MFVRFSPRLKMGLQKFIDQVAKNLGKDVALREENNIWDRNDKFERSRKCGISNPPLKILEVVASYTNIFYLWYFFYLYK